MSDTAKAPVSAATRSKRRAETAAKAVIWSAALLTIAILFFIVGFIVVRGFYSSGTYEYDVVSTREASFDGWTLVVNKRIRLADLPFEKAAGIFSGAYIDWAKLSEQGYELRALVPSGAAGEDALRALGLNKADESPLAEAYGDPKAALSLVASDPGAAAILSAEAAKSLPRGVRPLPVRRIAVAVNPTVTKLVGNNVLRSLSPEQRTRLFSGDAANWKEVGGIDLPVTLVLPPEGSALSRTLVDGKLLSADLYKSPRAAGKAGAAVIAAADDAQYASILKNTVGAAGYRYWGTAKKDGLSIVRVQRVENGPNLTLSFLYEQPRMSGRVGGISTIILNTILMIALTLLIAAPIGVFAAVYLVEYAAQGRLVRILRLGAETLAGIPSIIFGLFGMLFFVNILGWGIGLLSGVLTLTLMILPTIVRTSEEALKTVPMSLREGSLALGATKLQTVMKVAVPAASPGILAGVILAVGRAVGETAALIFTMGSSYDAAKSLFSSARVLSVHIYLIIAEGISLDRAFATATVLIFIILLVNLATTRVIGRFNKMSGK